uniref:N-acetyltransferase domain-containing protein n=1 Tax=Pseudo-nitzschia australis TaxID=44445 RepID=A0A7S4APG6_9STRA|mmetsp:Transcript_9465/g.20096  ORF Transcript_9465/g.20096 Transcript_9465/m.20096 type:complete len:188 (+) Transcript_9465:311-874(+)|eukprot:CAMPEP_0168193036 /NCGR_PEP_ID=MMETSP0139_2-20121125/18375_1 /TAXON_ID=44445 /ORGANISM="Pseudo-nitzschia australis, Strain 10249 10 AB" /LENGTH=187 /DNA_ID=CAMNT_0008116331 /DNA_START=263 /DNA_END=826 /DNA_ORIENTATION=-
MVTIEEEKPEITYKIAWQKKDEKIQKDACAVWESLQTVKTPEQATKRAQYLCVVAYHGDQLVGMSTAVVGMQKQVYANAIHFRCLVNPDYRKQGIATEMATRALVATEEWSKKNPSKKVLAFVMCIESQTLALKCYEPVWNNKINFIGYSEQGLPLYLRWFKHATFGNIDEDPNFVFYPSRPGIIGP